MAINLNTYSNVDFQNFVDFARVMVDGKGDANAIARVDTGINISEGALAGRTVTASDTDSIRGIFKWFRSSDDKAANNEARKIFKDAIISMFGGESNIPNSVKDAMRMADYNKGKPLTARRILIVKEAIDSVINTAIGNATAVAKNKASIVYSHMSRSRTTAEVDTLIDKAIEQCNGDKDALEIISNGMGSILLRGDCKLRSADAVRQKVGGILDNLAEMRKAAGGNRAVLAACKELLMLMDGKSLPVGHLPEIMRMVAAADTSIVGQLKRGASAQEIDSAVRLLGNITNKLMIDSGVDRLTDGADEKDLIRDFIASLVIAKVGKSDARKLQQVLMSTNAQKLLTLYRMVLRDDIRVNNLSPGHLDYVRLGAQFADKLLVTMKDTVDSALGMERLGVEEYPGKFNTSAIGDSEILERITTNAKAMMESQRDEKIAKYVDGNGPGADEIRALYANKMGPEPDSGRDADLEHMQRTDVRNVANWTIASECKKCMAGDFQNTYFARDVASDLNVTFPDGTKMSKDFTTARDQIASFVTGNAVAKYDNLDAIGKGKANIVMALLSQETVRSAYDSHARMLDPDNNTPQYSIVSNPNDEKKEFKLSLTAEGKFGIAFTGEKQLQKLTVNVPEAKGSWQSKTVDVKSGSTIGMKFTLSLDPAEFNRMAQLNYSTFDDTDAKDILNDDSKKAGKLEQAVTNFKKDFLLNTGYVSIHTDFSAKFN